jgi:hypothetical protein
LSPVRTKPATSHLPPPTSHLPLPTSHFSPPTAHCPLPPAIPACKASSTSPGCNPGSAPNENTRPVRAALSYRPGNAPPNAHVEQGCISKHRSTDEHRGLTAAQRHRARMRPKSSVFTPKTAASLPIPHPATPAATHPTHPKHAAFIRELPLQGEAPGGRPDLAFHASLIDLALQAATTAELSHATNGFPRHHRLPTSHFPPPTSHFSLLTAHCPLPTAHCPLPTSPCDSGLKGQLHQPGVQPRVSPQREHTPCKGSSQLQPRQRSSNAHVEAGWILKHRGTEEHRGVKAAQRNHSRLRPRPSSFTPKTAGSRQIPHPATPATPHPTHPKHAAFI